MLIDFLNNYKTEIFVIIVIIIHYILYILLYFDIVILNKPYIDILNTVLQIFISFYLIYRFAFSSYNNIISKFDKRVITTCATFILVNVLIKDFLNYETGIHYMNKYSNKIMNLSTVSYQNKATKSPSIYDYLPVEMNDI
jgi:hypothetical protein